MIDILIHWLRRRNAFLVSFDESWGPPMANSAKRPTTCATMLFAEGRNAVQAERWLGHRSAAFTLETYVRTAISKTL